MDVAGVILRMRSVKMVRLGMGFRDRQLRRWQQRRQGNQVWRLPRGARCPSAWAQSQGYCQQPWQVARGKRAAGAGQRGWQPRPRTAAAPTAKAAGGSAAAGPKAAGAADPKAAGGSVGTGSAMGPAVTAASGGSAAETTAASGPSMEVAGGSMIMTAAALGPTAKVAVGSVKMVAASSPNAEVASGSGTMVAPGPMAEADAEGVGEMMGVGLGPVAKEADGSTVETTMKVVDGTLTVTTRAATSDPTVKVAGGRTVTSGPTAMSAISSSGVMGSSAKMANQSSQSLSFGSQVSNPLPKDNSGISVSTVEPSSSTLAFKGSVVSMVATKRYNNNVRVCGTPAAKLLKLPGPDDNHSPALLEAFKAVVTAGGSGWLDPVAVAAVKTVLEVGCSSEEDLGNGSRETSGKSNEPQQLTWTPTRLVTERKRKKKPISQERTTLVNLVPCTEDRLKEHKPNPLGSEDQTEAYNMEPMFSFSPPESPIGSMVPGGDNFMQAEPKEIWICGHSVILVTKRRARTHPHGLQLGFPSSSAVLYWHGIQAMLWDQLLPLLHEIYHLRSFPSIIVIHLGENDLVQHTSMSLIDKMKNDLGILRKAFPDAHIIWSSLLPRRFWKGAEKPVSIEKARKGINREMSHYCSENGIMFLRHDLITYDKSNMFLPDVDDLSDVGADVFTADLKEALHSCLGFGKG